MSVKYDFTSGSGATFETVNPARPKEIVGRYSWTDEAEIPGIVERANTPRQHGQRCRGLNAARVLMLF